MSGPLPHRGGKRAGTEQRITTCTVCRHGVFAGQSWVWSVGRVLGIIHVECVR